MKQFSSIRYIARGNSLLDQIFDPMLEDPSEWDDFKMLLDDYPSDQYTYVSPMLNASPNKHSAIYLDLIVCDKLNDTIIDRYFIKLSDSFLSVLNTRLLEFEGNLAKRSKSIGLSDLFS